MKPKKYKTCKKKMSKINQKSGEKYQPLPFFFQKILKLTIFSSLSQNPGGVAQVLQRTLTEKSGNPRV